MDVPDRLTGRTAHSCPKRELQLEVAHKVTFSPTIPSSSSQRTSIEHHLQPETPSALVFCFRSCCDRPVSDDLLSKPGPTRSYLGTTTLSALAFYALGGQCFCLPCCLTFLFGTILPEANFKVGTYYNFFSSGSRTCTHALKHDFERSLDNRTKGSDQSY